jgi:hypothetical protein
MRQSAQPIKTSEGTLVMSVLFIEFMSIIIQERWLDEIPTRFDASSCWCCNPGSESLRLKSRFGLFPSPAIMGKHLPFLSFSSHLTPIFNK